MLSIIIPTRHKAAGLKLLLADISPYYKGTDSVQDNPKNNGHIILSDSGFDKATLEDALGAGCNLALGCCGRGWQLARGAKLAMMMAKSNDYKAQEHWMLFLHADSQLPQNWDASVRAHMQDHPDKAAYFQFKLNDEGFWPRLFERGVAQRCKLFGLPYGDQGLLIRQDLYERAGGYPQWELFEDVALVRAISRKNLQPLSGQLVTDAYKYKKDGYVRRSFKNMALLLKFLCGVSPERLSASYLKRDT